MLLMYYRYHMVHNELQYEFIYQYVHYWFNQLNIDDTHHAPRKIISNPEPLPEQVQEEHEEQDEHSSSIHSYQNTGESGEGEDALIEQELEMHDSGENPDLMLDMINKPPPISKNKPKFTF